VIFPTLNLALSQRRYNEMEASGEFAPAGLTSAQQQLRERVLKEIGLYSDRIKQSAVGFYDIVVGHALYKILSTEGMNIRTAADDGFWRFLSLKLLPDLVKSRWDNGSAVRFWKGRSRIWLRAMWWTIHLTWQGTEEKTKSVLETATTDTVMQLIERPGRAGFRIELTRALFAERSIRKISQSQFRAIMKLNTAKVLVIEPSCHEGGVKGYVRTLFIEIGCFDTTTAATTEA